MKPVPPPDETSVFPNEAKNPNATGSTNILNSPEIDETGKPTKRAISDAKQAYSIAKNLRDRAKLGRIKTAAILAEKYNGGSPFNEADLARSGQTWRNNFSTNWLASIIDRVKPQMLDPVNKADVLTHSMLPPGIDDAASKSRTFCEVTTKVIRRWPEWRDFASQLAQENTLFGISTPAWIDSPTEWRPRLWRFDETFLPEGTGQHSSKVQVACFEQKMLLHEFIQLFPDRRTAEKNCYNFENCILAANRAHTTGRGNEDETMLQREDRVREGNHLADSYDDKAKTVNLFHILVADYTGGVDLWTVSQDEGMEIRSVENMHGSMEDGITLFTFQSGNGKLYGSKGLGRLLANLHIAIERGRCLGADQMYLSGLVIFKTDKKDAATLQAKVQHPFVFVDKSMEIVDQQIAFSTTAFEMMDAKLNQIGESIAGAFIPPNLDQQGANTKIEAAANAERELAVKEGVLGRFFDHLSDLVSAMQRKIYCDINLREGKRAFDKKTLKQQQGIKVLMRKVWALLKKAFGADKAFEPDLPESMVADDEAVSAVIELLEAGLTVDEIATLALSPSAQSNATDGASRDAATVNFIAQNAMNPFIDQKAATEMNATIQIGPDRARQILVPTDDPQVDNIAIRQQIIESSEMLDGKAMPVARSDKHSVHRQQLAQDIAGIIQTVQTAPTPAIVQTAQLMLSHYLGHIEQDAIMPVDQKTQEQQAVKADFAIVQKVVAQQAKAAQDAQANGQPDPSNLPVGVNGQPPQVGPNGQVVGEDPNARQSIHPDDAALHIKMKELSQKDRALDLEQQAHELEKAKIASDTAIKVSQVQHQQKVDALKLQQGNMGIAQKALSDGADIQGDNQDRALQAQIAQQQAGAQALQQQLDAAAQAQEPPATA